MNQSRIKRVVHFHGDAILRTTEIDLFLGVRRKIVHVSADTDKKKKKK